MTEEEAAWVRDNVWSLAMRKSYRDNPLAAHVCACQFTPSPRCGQPGYAGHSGDPRPETFLTDNQGRVLPFPQREVQVWLADRACRWLCPCVQPEPTLEPALEPEPDGLFPLPAPKPAPRERY